MKALFVKISLVAIGAICGVGSCFVFQSFLSKESGSFSTQNIDGQIIVMLRGHPVVRLKDQVTHFKFFITGANVRWTRAVLHGSVDANGLVGLNWQDETGSEMMSWNWLAENPTITSVRRSQNLQFGDVFVDKK